MKNNHPSQLQLIDFVLGKLDEPTSGQIEVHLASCLGCCERLQSLDSTEDRLVANLKKVHESTGESLADTEHLPIPFFAAANSLSKTGDTLRSKSANGWASPPAIAGYDIISELGRGGMGIVYKARQLRLNRLVAIKMIKATGRASPEDRVRFAREAQTIAGLQHPNIVQIYEFNVEGDHPYFVLELVACGSLADQLSGKPLSPHAAAGLVETLGRAIHFAHQRGIVHRDLKPANILIGNRESGIGNRDENPDPQLPTRDSGFPTPDPRLIKITDFGLAKHMDVDLQLTQSGTIAGTPSYMAPEQVRGCSEQVGPATDVYALGAILYELLVGRPPFLAATPLEIVRQVADDEPVPLRRLQSQIPKGLETICLKCLEKDSRRRYASAEALANDLQRFREGKSVAAKPSGFLQRVYRWAKRKPSAAGLVALLILAGIAAVAGLFFYQQSRISWAADEARRLAEVKSRRELLEQKIDEALDKCENSLSQLRSRLRDSRQAQLLISDIHGWRQTIESARGQWQLAKTLADTERQLISGESIQRLVKLNNGLATAKHHWLLAQQLDETRLQTAVLEKGKLDLAAVRKKYAGIFAGAELDISTVDPQTAADRIRRSPLRFAFVAALDHWCGITPLVSKTLPRMLKLSRLADPDGWRDRFRNLITWSDLEKLEALAAESGMAKQSPHLLNSLARRMYACGGDPIPMLRRALVHNPRDFWFHFDLGTLEEDPRKQAACLRVAVHLRPQNGVAHHNLGTALKNSGDLPGAIYHLQEALSIDPKVALTHYSLAEALKLQDDLSGAIRHFQKALERDRNLMPAYNELGNALTETGDFAGAAACFGKALEIDNNSPETWCNLGQALRRQGKFADSLRAFEKGHEFGSRRADWTFPSKRFVEEGRRVLQLNGQETQSPLELRKAGTILAGKFTEKSPVDFHTPTRNNYRQSYALQLKAGCNYRVGLQCDFQAVFRIEDAGYTPLLQKTIVRPDQKGNMELVYSPPISGLYRLAVISPKTGFFNLKIGEVTASQPLVFLKRVLTGKHQTEKGKYLKKHKVRFDEGRIHTIQLNSRQFDPILLLLDSTGTKILLKNDDVAPGNTNSHIDFEPKESADYWIVVTSFQANRGGAYTLVVHEHSQ